MTEIDANGHVMLDCHRPDGTVERIDLSERIDRYEQQREYERYLSNVDDHSSIDSQWDRDD